MRVVAPFSLGYCAAAMRRRKQGQTTLGSGARMTHELRARRAVSLDRGKRWMMVALGAGALLGAASLAPVAAQQPGAAGTGDSQDVTVDLSVLDQLGPPATAPGGEPIVLTPPRAKSAKQATAKAQPATGAAAAKGRLAAKPARATAGAVSTPPPSPPESVSGFAPAASAAEGQAPGSPPGAAPAAGGQAPGSQAAAAPETSAPTPPGPESSAPEATTSAAAAASVATPPPPAAAAIAKAPAPGAASPQPTTPPRPAAKSSALPAMPGEPAGEKALSLNFGPGAADLTDAAKSELGKFAGDLKKNGDLRLQLVAYAAGTEAEASQARRLALTRALAVRSYLIEQGVSSVRMDVRALGNKVENGGPADRVDLVLIGKK